MDRFDAILQRVGAFGKWQRLQFLILSPSALLITWQNLLYIFVTYIPFTTTGICIKDDNEKNETINEQFCEETCKNVTFRSAVHNWPHLCSSNASRPSVQAVYFVGFVFGTVVFYYATKRFGRKRVALFCALFTALCGSIAPYSYFYLVFDGFRWFTGFFVSGLQLCLWFLSLEMTGSMCHPLILCLWRLSDIIGYVTLAIVVALTNAWDYTYVVCSASFVVLLLHACLIPESAKWLLTKGRKADTERILRKIAIANGHILRHESVRLKSGEIYSYRQYTRKHVTHDAKMLTWSIILILVWILIEFAYYVLSLSIPRINRDSSNMIINHTVCGLAELPALILIMICLKRVPRKRLAYFGGACCIVFSFICSIIPSAHITGIITIGAISKFGLYMLYISLQILTLEMYPNELRPVAFFSFVATSKFGAILAPYCESAMDPSKLFIPFVSVGAACSLSTILIVFLPETLGANESREGSGAPPSSSPVEDETDQTISEVREQANDEDNVEDLETNIENVDDANAPRIEMKNFRTTIEIT